MTAGPSGGMAPRRGALDRSERLGNALAKSGYGQYLLDLLRDGASR